VNIKRISVFEILTAVLMKTQVLRRSKFCGGVNIYRSFGGVFCYMFGVDQ
jgi:hypothetical protein